MQRHYLWIQLLVNVQNNVLRKLLCLEPGKLNIHNSLLDLQPHFVVHDLRVLPGIVSIAANVVPVAMTLRPFV